MNKANAGRVVEYLEACRSDLKALLETLVAAESPSEVKQAHRNTQDLITTELENAGYLVKHVPGKETGGHLFARPLKRKRGQKLQLLIGHSDTVWPLGTIEKMPLKVEAGEMKGPGVFDMKAGLVEIIFSLRCLKDLGLTPEVTPIVFINSDEEIGSPESDRHIHRLAKIVDRALVLEPPLGSAGKIKTERKGVGRFRLTVKGKAAHAGLNPQDGANAIVELAHQVQRLAAMNDIDRGISVNVGTIEGGIGPNVVAPESTAAIDVRVESMADAEDITARILGLQPQNSDVVLEVSGAVRRPPLEETPRNMVLWRLAVEMGDLLGIELEKGMAGGGSDGNTTSLYTATLDGLGTTGDGAHAIHEFIDLEKQVERTALLTLILLAGPVQPVSDNS